MKIIFCIVAIALAVKLNRRDLHEWAGPSTLLGGVMPLNHWDAYISDNYSDSHYNFYHNHVQVESNPNRCTVNNSVGSEPLMAWWADDILIDDSTNRHLNLSNQLQETVNGQTYPFTLDDCFNPDNWEDFFATYDPNPAQHEGIPLDQIVPNVDANSILFNENHTEFPFNMLPLEFEDPNDPEDSF